MIAGPLRKAAYRPVLFTGWLGILFAAIALDGAAASFQTTEKQADAALARGVQMLREGHAADAMPELDAAVLARPRSAAALTWRGIGENQIGRYEAAANDLREAVRLDGTSPSAHYNLALSLIRLRKFDAAIVQLQTVVKLQPEAVPPRYNLGVLLEEKNQISGAADQLRQAHILAPGDAEVSLHLLEDLLQLRKMAEVPALVEELMGDSVSVAMQQAAGGALLQAERFDDARSLLERAKARETDDRDLDLLLARTYVGEGRNADAIALLTGVQGAQTDEEVVYTTGLAYLGAGDGSSAQASLQQAAILDPKDGRPLYRLALLMESSPGEVKKAEGFLRRALQLDPNNRPASLALARLLLVVDETEEAKTILTDLRPQPEDDVERSTLLGVALASSNEVSKAIPMLQHAHTLDPQLALADNVLGFCYFHGGDFKRAAEAYHLASDLEAKRLLYARDAALAYRRADVNASALRYAQRAAELPDATAGDYALLGKLYVADGRPKDAIRLLRRAAEADPNLDAALYLLARLYQRMGDREEAAEWNRRLQAVKERQQTTFVENKKKRAAVQSSQVLRGDAIADDSGDME